MADDKAKSAKAKNSVSCESIIIDSVNPKFKAFNRPLLVAVLVGVSVACFWFPMLNNMLYNMHTLVTAVVPGWRYKDLQLEIDIQGGCILLTSHMMQPPYSGSSSQNIGFLMESRCHLPNEQEYCSGTNNPWSYDARAGIKSAAEADVPDCEIFPPNSGGKESRFLYLVYSQPTHKWQSALGASLGYLGVIEFCYTLIVVIPMIMCGCLSMKNSYLSQWVRAEIISAGVDMGAQVLDNV